MVSFPLKNEENSKIIDQTNKNQKNQKNQNSDKKEILEDSNEILEAVEINNIIDDPKDFEHVMKNSEVQEVSKGIVENIITFVDQQQYGNEKIQDNSSGRHHEIESIIIEIKNNSSNITSNNGNQKSNINNTYGYLEMSKIKSNSESIPIISPPSVDSSIRLVLFLFLFEEV